MPTKTLLLSLLLSLLSASAANAQLVLSVDIWSGIDETNLELRARTTAEDPECAGGVWAEANLYVNNQLIDTDFVTGGTCSATAVTAVHNRPWSQIADDEIYENLGNGAGSTGGACETATLKTETFDKQCRRERTLQAGVRAEYVVCSGPGCRFEANRDTAYIWAHIVHVYIDTYPDPPYKFTVQCYASSHSTIASCSSPKP
jgi:hypothetical protein